MQFSTKSNLVSNTKKDFNKSSTTIYLVSEKAKKELTKELKDQAPKWQLDELKKSSLVELTGKKGPIFVLTLNANSDDYLSQSPYASARELTGALCANLLKANSKDVTLHLNDLGDEQAKGAIVGLELALYRFEDSKKLGKISYKRDGKKLADSFVKKASSIGVAVNQARHLVNLPPNYLHPESYASELKKLYSKSKTIKVEVLDEKKLKKENCGLLLSVGSSAKSKPRIVRLKYRPTGVKGKSIAFVGKGLTFDSGGLDVKSAAGMRFMKKDMGGSATLVGLSRWLETSGIKKNVDIWLAMAENAISENASRPGDIFTARNGMKVEIHNTDAEGRLAMADAIDMALDEKPSTLIDVATLTGAGKVALGQDIASLFSNDDELADKLLMSSHVMGDLAWRMPLYNPYFKGLSSDFSDMANAASGHGGAITAALFLQKFVGKTKWAHFDIFSWTSGSKPSLVQKGGSGQAVETLIGFLS